MAEETTNPTPETPTEDKKVKATAAADKPKKEKAPALEDKPFAEFINEHYLPSLRQNLEKLGITDLDLQFVKQPLPVKGVEEMGECWQVIGKFQQRSFGIGFSREDINSQKFFYCADPGAKPSLLESFMIDERRVNLDLLVLYAEQRLNGQKWLTKN